MTSRRIKTTVIGQKLPRSIFPNSIDASIAVCV